MVGIMASFGVDIVPSLTPTEYERGVIGHSQSGDQPDLGSGNLTVPSISTQLPYGLGDMVSGKQIGMREQPPMGVNREGPTGAGPSVLEERPTFALVAEAEVLELKDRANGEA